MGLLEKWGYRKKPEPKTELEKFGFPASDAALTSDPGEYVQAKPIRIKHYQMSYPVTVMPGCTLVGTLSSFDGEKWISESTPAVTVNVAATFDRCAKIEVIDDLGFDIGIGYIWGQTKKQEPKVLS